MKGGFQILAVLSLLVLAGCIDGDTTYVCSDGTIVDDPTLCPVEGPEPDPPAPPEPDYTELLNEYNDFVDQEEQLLVDDGILISEHQQPNQTKEGATSVIQVYSTHADEFISFYADLESFIVLNKGDLEEAGINTTETKAHILKERLRIRHNLGVMREVMDLFRQDSPGDMEVVNTRNKLVYQISQLPEPDYTELLNEYDAFMDREEPLLVADSKLLDDWEDPGIDIKDSTWAYSENTAELISLYSEWETFIDANRAGLETAGIDTTTAKADTLEQRENLRYNLKIMRKTIDLFRQLGSEDSAELIPIRNRLVYQISQLDAVLPTPGDDPDVFVLR